VLTIKEASETFGIPRGTLYDYVKKGKLKVVRHPLGWGFLIPESEIPKLQAISDFYAAKAAKEEEGEVNV
jgi:excisionase family DNA binding protein